MKKMKLNELDGKLTSRTVILGVGNEIKGDDGLGPYIAKGLDSEFIAIDGKSVPEAYAHEVISHSPKVVLIVDAAKMGSRPGSVGLFKKEDVKNLSFSSHSMPLSMLAKHLENNTGCSVFIIGIEPEDTNFGMNLTDTVKESANDLMKLLIAYKKTDNEKNNGRS